MTEAAKKDPELSARLQAVGAAQHQGEKPSDSDIKWIENRADKALDGSEKSAREAMGLGKPGEKLAMEKVFDDAIPLSMFEQRQGVTPPTPQADVKASVEPSSSPSNPTGKGGAS